MNLFAAQGRVAAEHPKKALIGLLLVTILMSIGLGLTESTGDQIDAFLPDSNPAAQAETTISDRFEGAAVGQPVQLIARGDVLTPAALQATLEASDTVVAVPEVSELLAPGAPVDGYAQALQWLSPAVPLGDLDQADIDALIADAPDPVTAALDQLVARDDSGTVIGGLTVVNLADSDDFDQVEAAELAANDAVADLDFSGADVEIRTFSNGKLNQEINDSQGSTTVLLLGLALFVILVLLAVFYRTGSDVALSLGGLIVTIIWVFGLQGLLGPGGIGIIGASSPLATMIPVLLIGLTVDFALQVTGNYREQLEKGRDVKDAITRAVKNTGLPLFLAAVTTMISFFTNITNSIPALKDFGIIAGLGVFFGYIVMTTLVPAVRSILDQGRVVDGKDVTARLLADAIPGAGRVTGGIAKGVTRYPLPILVGFGIVAAVAGFAANNIETSFSDTDFLPEDTEAYEDITFLEEAFGGGSTTTSVLITGDATNDKTVRDIIDFEAALANPATRPNGVTGAPAASTLALVEDWSTDSGFAGDNFDQDFADYIGGLDLGFVVEGDTFIELYAELGRVDQAGLDRVLSLGDGDESDLTVIRIPTASGDPELTSQIADDLKSLWDGDPDAIALTGPDILIVSITDEMVDSQRQSIALTILAALMVLIIFFGVTKFRPMLGVLAVIPIALVVVCVLGTMVALGISYNVITALITALTIGVGVDYTIHITDRFIEEREDDPNASMTQTMSRVMQTTGAALIGSALTTALGFAVLLFSPLAAMQQFGLLTAVTIFYSLIAAFVVLPPMLVLWALYHQWRRDHGAAGSRHNGRRDDQTPGSTPHVAVDGDASEKEFVNA
ncbi:MAG: MMPL family transporter [Sulfitobacter sp.]|nr:MMPL family transporter [Sulfitobacter sp.]